MSDDRIERGMRVRREVLGDAHVDAAAARTSDVTRAFQDYLTGAAWADVWDRPGLDRRMRSAVTLGLLTALRAEGELAIHLRGALRNGLTRDEIVEVLLHAAVYAGMPAANAAFAIADEVLSQEPEGG